MSSKRFWGWSAAILVAVIVWAGNGSEDEDPAQPVAAASTTTPVPTPTPTSSDDRGESTPTPQATEPAAAPTAEPAGDTETGTASPALWTVTNVVDGDTIDVEKGATQERVRIIGIDTPEDGECGDEDAAENLRRLASGERVELRSGGSGADNRDSYDRLLRYVIVGPGKSSELDTGYEQIAAGLAIARYDSRDGYGAHTREAEYVKADDATPPSYSCAPAPEPEPEPEPKPQPEEVDSSEPWNLPGPDLDCPDIGKKVRITGTDYHRLDADGDGWGCDSYG